MPAVIDYANESGTAASDLHARQPIYLTNCCCDPADGSKALLDSLGIACGHPTFGDDYPLTKAEERLIAEDSVGKAFGGGAMMGHTSLYRGKKYLMPCIDVCFLGTGRFSDKSYGGSAFKDKATALAVAQAYADLIRPMVEAYNVGGHVLVAENVEPDRIVIQMLFPFKFANRVNAEIGWFKYIEQLVNVAGMSF